MSELNPHGLLPRCIRFTPASRPARGNTRYRSARYGFDRAGLNTGWTSLRGFTDSFSTPPLPRLSQRDSLDFHGERFA